MFPARVTDSIEEWTNSSSLIWKQIKGNYSESRWNQANRFSIHGKKKKKKKPYNRQGGEKKNESYNRLGEIDH